MKSIIQYLMNNMSKTSASQRKASAKYYNDHKQEINEKRKEYFLAYNKNKYDEIRNDDEKRLQRNEYFRNYRKMKKQQQ